MVLQCLFLNFGLNIVKVEWVFDTFILLFSFLLNIMFLFFNAERTESKPKIIAHANPYLRCHLDGSHRLPIVNLSYLCKFSVEFLLIVNHEFGFAIYCILVMSKNEQVLIEVFLQV